MPTPSVPNVYTDADPDVTISQTRLEKCEDIIRKGSKAFMDVGRAIAEIRDGKGYKRRGFKTFEDYCDKSFGISVRHGQRLMQSAQTADTVKRLTGYVPGNESVARALAPVVNDPTIIQKVSARLEKKHQTFATASAEAVDEAVRTITGKSPAPSGRGAGVRENGHDVAVVGTAIPLTPGSDECPHCHEKPDHWQSADEVWLCSECGESVTLVVSALPRQNIKALKPKSCPACKKSVMPGVPFCPNCGGVIR